MALKRTPPIAFFAMVYGPIDPDPDAGIDDESAAISNAQLMADVANVQAALQRAHPAFAGSSFSLTKDQFGKPELWFSVEDEALVLLKRDLAAIAEAVRETRPERSVYIWLRDRDDSEYGLEVFRDAIKPDPYRAD